MSDLATNLPPIILNPPPRDTTSVLPVILAEPAPASVVVVPVGAAAAGEVADLIDAALAGYATTAYVDEHTGAAVAGGWSETVSAPATLVQVVHGLTFRPSGVICVDNAGNEVFWSTKTDPSTGITELTFGFPFTGTITLS